jgi:hypothetical protein
MVDDHSRLAYAEVLEALTAEARSVSCDERAPGLRTTASSSSG